MKKDAKMKTLLNYFDDMFHVENQTTTDKKLAVGNHNCFLRKASMDKTRDGTRRMLVMDFESRSKKSCGKMGRSFVVIDDSTNKGVSPFLRSNLSPYIEALRDYCGVTRSLLHEGVKTDDDLFDRIVTLINANSDKNIKMNLKISRSESTGKIRKNVSCGWKSNIN